MLTRLYGDPLKCHKLIKVTIKWQNSRKAEYWRNTACIQHTLFIPKIKNQAHEIERELGEERVMYFNWNRKGVLLICS